MCRTKKVSVDARELSETELAQIGGGMKWDRNHVSTDVIDARGGSMTVFGVTMTFDLNGKCSSVSPAR